MFCVGGADAALLAPEFHLLEANALADQLPFKAWGCGARAIADTIRSVARRAWRSPAADSRPSLRRAGGISVNICPETWLGHLAHICFVLEEKCRIRLHSLRAWLRAHDALAIQRRFMERRGYASKAPGVSRRDR